MSELFDNQVNVQKQENFRVHASSRKPIKKYVIKMKETRKNNVCVKMLLMEGKQSCENDFDEPRINDSGHNDGTICLVSG